MKYLTVFRHAKAEHVDSYASDFERPLTSRGQKDAYQISEILAGFEPAVDWIMSSPARRTRETTIVATAALRFKRGVVWQDSIYEADAETLLKVLSDVPVEMEHALIIGHNPGMEELVSGLAAGSATRLGIHLPTAGLVHLTLEIFSWNQIRWGCGTLQVMIRPKLLRSK